MSNWFTSDQHLGHMGERGGIIKLAERPFKNVEHMNNCLIENWNKFVSEEDTVYVVGDFCFYNGKLGYGIKSTEYEKLLNGKIIFIKGNHDKNNSTKTILSHAVVNIGGYNIVLIHKPEDIFRFNVSLKGIKFVFCGHVHKAWKFRFKGEYRFDFKNKTYTNSVPFINVGVDMWNYKPVSYQEIYKCYVKTIKKRNSSNN